MLESNMTLPATESEVLDTNGLSDKQLHTQARDKAIMLLARREHSRVQLAYKLNNYRDSVDIEALLDDLADLDLQSDRRYAGMLVRSKAQAGYGLARIRQWAKEYGLNIEYLDLAIEEEDHDWFAAALRQRQKHFGMLPPGTIQDKAKQMRYLYNRGFSQDQIQYAVEAEPDLA